MFDYSGLMSWKVYVCEWEGWENGQNILPTARSCVTGMFTITVTRSSLPLVMTVTDDLQYILLKVIVHLVLAWWGSIVDIIIQ